MLRAAGAGARPASSSSTHDQRRAIGRRRRGADDRGAIARINIHAYIYAWAGRGPGRPGAAPTLFMHDPAIMHAKTGHTI